MKSKIKKREITEKRPHAVGGGNLDSGHEATIESLLGLVEINIFSGLHEILELFLRDGDGKLLFVILFTYLQ